MAGDGDGGLEVIESASLQAVGHALAGAAAGGVSLLLMYPADTYKTRACIDGKPLMEIIHSEGMGALYDGGGHAYLHARARTHAHTHAHTHNTHNTTRRHAVHA